jgi:hypothetical protein
MVLGGEKRTKATSIAGGDRNNRMAKNFGAKRPREPGQMSGGKC